MKMAKYKKMSWVGWLTLVIVLISAFMWLSAVLGWNFVTAAAGMAPSMRLFIIDAVFLAASVFAVVELVMVRPKMKPLEWVATVLVLVGAFNAGLGVAHFNLVDWLFGVGSFLAGAVYVLVGVSGIYVVYALWCGGAHRRH